MSLPRMPVVGEQTYYEILEVDPGATDEEVRRARKRVEEIYSKDSMVVYTLFVEDELDQLKLKIAEAYDTIIDPRKRREYDLWLLKAAQSSDRGSRTPGGEPADERRATTGGFPSTPQPIPDSLPPGIEIGDDTVFDGELLQRIREHKGIDLRDVGNRTKISLMNLRFIEEGAYRELPAPVYVRGFLTEYARYLRLPTKQVADSYLAVYNESMAEGEADL